MAAGTPIQHEVCQQNLGHAVHSKTGLSGDPRPLSLRLGKKRVPCWEMVKLRDFGVLLDPKLAFSHHVSAVWQKVTHPLPK